MFDIFILIVVLSIFILIIFDYFRDKSKHKKASVVNYNRYKDFSFVNNESYKVIDSLIDDISIRFYKSLLLISSELNYITLVRISLSSIFININQNHDIFEYYLLSTIGLDFVLFDYTTFKPIIGIILDDSKNFNDYYNISIFNKLNKLSDFKIIYFDKSEKYDYTILKEKLLDYVPNLN